MENSQIKTLSPLEQKLNALFEKVFSRISFVDKMLFVFHLQIMIKAGLSIVAALKILSEEMENKKLRKIIAQIKNEVEKGRQLSEVLAQFPDIFPEIYVSMIAAGEAAGTMEKSLLQVYSQMKKSHELLSHVRGAMVYPAVVVVAIIGIAVEMIVFVLPKILVMFKDFNAELPLPTRILIAIVDFTQEHGIELIVGLFLLIALWFYLYKKPNFKRVIHSFTLRLPIFGKVIKEINLASFTLTLSSLLDSTIPIIDAVKITSSVQTNMIYRETLLKVAENLKSGTTLSQNLSPYHDIFPPMVTEMIMVGEEAGKMNDMLKELSEYYANEVDSMMKNFSTIIEPVIILIMGLMVAGIAVAVIMPMYSLAQSF